MTQRDGMGREVGDGFRMGNTCTPMADACWCMAKQWVFLIQHKFCPVFSTSPTIGKERPWFIMRQLLLVFLFIFGFYSSNTIIFLLVKKLWNASYPFSENGSPTDVLWLCSNTSSFVRHYWFLPLHGYWNRFLPLQYFQGCFITHVFWYLI